MKIKWNWGTGIAIFIAVFMVFMLTLVYKCTQQNVDLVSTNYYNQEIQYQKQINKINNSSELSSKVQIVVERDFIKIKLPDYFKGSELKGMLNFFKPDNAAIDFDLPLAIDQNMDQLIPSSKLKKGSWLVKVNYSDFKRDYYTEEKIFLN